MEVLVDTSVWIDYFQTGNKSAELDDLIDENIYRYQRVDFGQINPLLKVEAPSKSS